MYKKFDLAVPKTFDEAFGLLNGPKRARPIAGGTDLLLQLEKGVIQTDLLVDITQLPGISQIEEQGTDVIIGAAVTHAEVCNWAAEHKEITALYDACSSVGTPQIRNLATLVGNLCNAVPSADGAPPSLVLRGSIIAVGAAGKREIPLTEFFTGPKRTSLMPGELAIALKFPIPKSGSISCYRKLGPRKAADLAFVGVAVSMSTDKEGSLCELRIALGAVAPTPILVEGTDQFLGKKLDNQVLSQCCEIAANAARPITDYRASTEYRREMIKVETSRALETCWSQRMR